MPTLRDIKRRIKAVQSTRQITKAMKMVSASKFRKAQQKILELRPYAVRMNSVLVDLSASVELDLHPLLTVRPVKKVEVLVLTSDRGLCGAFNSNIMKTTLNEIAKLKKEGTESHLNVFGRKAYDFFRKRNYPTAYTCYGICGRISFLNAQEMANAIIERYKNEEIDEIIMIYNEFKSVITQKVVIQRLLPLTMDVSDVSKDKDRLPVFNYIYEPSKEELFNRLLPKNIEIQIYRALLESQASEEAARMSAMENATKSANEMIDNLTLQYNKARQNAITKELMDIVGGVEALKG
jgi:F-type H+-transporting ATPase subunit gamma